MKVLSFGSTHMNYIEKGRDIIFTDVCYIDVHTDEGVLKYTIKPGFVSDGRSGPEFIDPFVPHIGNNKTLDCWIIHDMNYYGFISKDLADDILKQMLKIANLGELKSDLVWCAVQMFGESSYGINTEDDRSMLKLIEFEWVDKNNSLK